MVSFALGAGQYYMGNLGTPASMIQPRTPTTTKPKTTISTKKSLIGNSGGSLPAGIIETSPGFYKDTKGNQVVTQKVGGETKYYTLKSEADDVFGYISYPTLYKPPPQTKKEKVDVKRDAIEEAVGSRKPIFEDLPQPEEQPIAEAARLPEDATPEQKEEAKLKDEARFREREEERQARRNQLKTFAGQRRSLLRPAARRPYYA